MSMQTLLSKVNFLLDGFGFKNIADFKTSTFGFVSSKHIQLLCAISGFMVTLVDKLFGFNWQFLMAYASLIIYEWITGVKASKKRGEAHQSRKTGRMLLKISVYTVLIIILNTFKSNTQFPVLFDFELDPFEFLYWFYLIIVIWQLTISVAENLVCLGYKWADKFIKVVNRTFYKKLELKEDD